MFRLLAFLLSLTTVQADLVTTTDEPWAFTAPRPRQALSPQGAAASPVGLDREARQHYEDALRSMSSNQLDQAAQNIQQALVLAPDHALVLSVAGRIFTRQRSFGLAANCWRQLLASYPGSANLRAELGGALLYMGKEKEARTAIGEAVAASPGDLTVRYYQALLSIKDRDLPAASATLGTLSGFQIGQTIVRLQEDRDLIVGLTSTEGYRLMARALLGSASNLEAERALPEVKRLLEQVQPAMQAGRWAEAAPILEALQKAGAGFPALDYDLGLCRYSLQPGPGPLDALEQFVTSPRGLGFRRLFAYLCLSARDAARADRSLGEAFRDQKDIEAVLLQAALRQGQDDEAGAWLVLEGIPPDQRAATQPWFQRDLPAVQALKNSDRFPAWLKPGKNE